MVKCDRRNCRLNEDGICEDGIIEDGYCKSQDLDYDFCEYCGAELIGLKEEREHFGIPCVETFWVCPNKCD